MAFTRLWRTGSLAAIIMLAQSISPSAQADDEVREFYIKTVHIDGQTSTHGDADHKAEPFPEGALPAGNGLQLKKPDDAGKWRIRAFTFDPSQIVVKAGEPVRPHFRRASVSHNIHAKATAWTRNSYSRAASCTRSTSRRRKPASSRSNATTTSRRCAARSSFWLSSHDRTSPTRPHHAPHDRGRFFAPCIR